MKILALGRYALGVWFGFALLTGCSSDGSQRAPSISTVHTNKTIEADISTANLYVANAVANTVTVYAPGETSPLRTIAEGVANPTALALDDKNKLYVANRASPGGTVTVYPPGSTNPARTIAQGVASPEDIKDVLIYSRALS